MICSRGLACGHIPGIKGKPALISLLASFQEFASPANAWLPDLASLTNEGKHDQFSPQQRVARPAVLFTNVTITGPGGAKLECKEFSLVSTGTLVLSEGGELRADGITIRGPRLIRGDRPYLDPPGPEESLIRKVTLVATHFTINNQPIHEFLRTAADGTERIVKALEAQA